MVNFIKLCTLLSASLMMGSAHAKYYDEKEILAETQWKGLGVKENAPNHLSILSQGKYDENVNGKYDNNFYFPSSAGEDIDIFVFDIGFNFTYTDFKNDDKREIECLVSITDGVVVEEHSKSCYSTAIIDHGTWASGSIAGAVNGIASKANIYAGLRYNASDDKDPAVDLLAFLQYVYNNKFREGKAVFNFSNEFYYSYDDLKSNETLIELQKLINEMSDKGAVFVASAGNDNSPAENISFPDYFVDAYPQYKNYIGKAIIPCVLDNVICVGGIANMNEASAGVTLLPPPYNDDMVSSNYAFKNNFYGSNYGQFVDIYAPYNLHYVGSSYHMDIVFDKTTMTYLDSFDIVKVAEGIEYIENFETIMSGTSFSGPLTAGVVAAIMSEFSNQNFTSASMLEFLREHAQKDIIQDLPEGSNNYLLNIGKMSIYSPDNEIDSDDEEVIDPVIADTNDDDSDFESNDEQ